MEPKNILKQFWGYNAFRPLQEEIIRSVLDGRDTLALLPTGGGKSICFQVPAMAKEGLCLVVSPLIALIKDQVEALQRKGIKALAVHSGMKRREVDIALDNCAYDQVKFLYLSPERLMTDIFKARLSKLPVTLLAVDEAHCISQWGYDFRPPYLQLGELRTLLPASVPCIALTATATKEVKSDIAEKLHFRTGNQLFQQSFARSNLSYSCRMTEDKPSQLKQILTQLPGTSIVYVRSRQRTVSIAAWLREQGVSAAAYHAGMSHSERSTAQDNWLQNRTRVMVATNAFGMGIDKPEVRSVIHLDLPDTLEAYYQEAGRAGRDGRYAYAIVLYAGHDLADLRTRVLEAHPESEFLQRVYQALANYYQLAVGSGLLQSFGFSLADFAKAYKFQAGPVHHALHQLETEGLISLTSSYYSPSRVWVKVEKMELYEFQVSNPQLDSLIKILLRSSGGEIFNNFVRIDELRMAKECRLSFDQLRQQLGYLDQLGIISYEPQTDQPQITFTQPRADAERMPLDVKRMQRFKAQALAKAESVIRYTTDEKRCRTLQLLEYFDEHTDKKCRVCDVCLSERKQISTEETQQQMQFRLLEIISQERVLPKEILNYFQPKEHSLLTEEIRKMVETGVVYYDPEGKLNTI
jgi:ATP-dependent DNA helicase RecQ